LFHESLESTRGRVVRLHRLAEDGSELGRFGPAGVTEVDLMVEPGELDAVLCQVLRMEALQGRTLVVVGPGFYWRH